jgi:hypothetical protein
MPRWTETQVRAKDVKFGPNDDKYGIVLDADTLVIDIDVHDPAKNGYAALERLSKDCGVDLLDVAAFVVESPSGGRHLYFSKASDLKLPKSTQQYAGLDFLSEGCQVIGLGVRMSMVVSIASRHLPRMCRSMRHHCHRLHLCWHQGHQTHRQYQLHAPQAATRRSTTSTSPRRLSST